MSPTEFKCGIHQLLLQLPGFVGNEFLFQVVVCWGSEQDLIAVVCRHLRRGVWVGLWGCWNYLYGCHRFALWWCRRHKLDLLLLLLLSYDVFVPTSAHPLMVLNKWFVQFFYLIVSSNNPTVGYIFREQTLWSSIQSNPKFNLPCKL